MRENHKGEGLISDNVFIEAFSFWVLYEEVQTTKAKYLLMVKSTSFGDVSECKWIQMTYKVPIGNPMVT